MEINLADIFGGGSDNCACDACRANNGEPISHPLPEVMVVTLKDLFEASQAPLPSLGSMMTPRKGIGYPNEGLPCVVIAIGKVFENPEDRRDVVQVIAFGNGRYQEMTFEKWELEPYSPAASEEPANAA
jgi:hypothetical protein